MTSDEPLIILGDEQQRLDPLLADGGLPPVVGAQAFCVFRATRGAPQLADGLGYTYHHHVDLACWRGKLYVGWNSCEKDEDVWPSRELLNSSDDGVNWSSPVEMFPQGLSTPLRMYFYRSGNDRMLVIAGLRLDTRKLREDVKAALIVRELRDDHSLGEVFTLQPPDATRDAPTPFDTSPDRGFVEACHELLGNTLFLEQQDRGRLLGPRRMNWHDAKNWPGGIMPGTGRGKWVFGKALSFEKRPDGAWLGVSKMGWCIVSHDDGKTWTAPVVPSSFVTGKAKAWLQRTRDGRYALVYNPSRRNRYPLVVATSSDCVHFHDMRLVQGELPIQRYPGDDRSIGPQYCRGISRWSSDGSRDDDAMWLVYSMNKEDIWVSRVPLPITPGGPDEVEDDFATFSPGGVIPGWNTHHPKWASVRVEGKPRELRLECRDPFDHAVATRCFHSSTTLTVDLRLTVHALRNEPAEIDLVSTFGGRRPVRVLLNPIGTIDTMDGDGERRVASFHPGTPLAVSIHVDVGKQSFSIAVDGAPLREFAFAQHADDVQRLVIRTGPYRNVGGLQPVDPARDVPSAPASLSIAHVRVA
jgi:hypothetical protein